MKLDLTATADDGQIADDPEARDRLRIILDKTRPEYKTVGDFTYSILRQAVLTGAFPPGARLRQDDLAEAIGVSRMPIRSALMQLESEGLVDFHPHRGAVVKALKPTQVREIYELRALLEGHALRRAIETMTPERLALLETMVARLDSAREGDEFLEARVAFYHELYRKDEYPLLLELIERLRDDVGRYLLGKRVIGSHGHTHGKLLEYVRENDADGAVSWLQRHLSEVGREMIERLEAE